MTNPDIATVAAGLTRPLIGIEHRTPQEVFDIMCDRIRMSGIEQQLDEAREENARLRHDWSRFSYGDPVEVARKRETAPEFPGFVIGWYERLDGARGYVLEHDPHRIVHVNPEGAVIARAFLTTDEQAMKEAEHG